MSVAKAYLFLLIFFGCLIDVRSQALSDNETFSIDFRKGCAPFTVEINQILDIPDDVSRQYTYEGENTPTLNTTHTYTEPGVYNIAQILGQDANKFDTLRVRVFEATDPSFNINQCSGNGIAITPFGGDYDSFRVFFTDTDFEEVEPDEMTDPFIYSTTGPQSIRVLGLFDDAEANCGEFTRTASTVDQLGAASITDLSISSIDDTDGAMALEFDLLDDIFYDLEVATNDDDDFQFLQIVEGINDLTIIGLDTENNSYCFRLSVTDACNGEVFVSNSVCSALLAVEAMNGFNEIQINRPTTYSGTVDIIKDGELLRSVSDPGETTVLDSLVTCAVENCYILNLNQGNVVFASTQECVEGISIAQPPPVNDITASIVDQDIQLSWRISENGVADTVAIRRARGNQSLSVIARTTEDEFIDPSPGVTRSSFTYDITYSDACGNQSETSTPAQTIFLESENPTGNVYNLSWNNYTGWFAGVGNYFLQRLDPAGTVTSEEKILSGFDTQVVLTNLDRDPVTFRIKAESLDLTPLESFSNSLTFEFVPELFIPGAFTPNDDELNDVLEVEGTFVASLKLQIFNRWGEVIFYTEDRNIGWDGTIGQKKAASGTYVYNLEYTDEVGRKFRKRGTFVLMR